MNVLDLYNKIISSKSRSYPPFMCDFDDALQDRTTGLYVGAMVVLIMNADGTALAPEYQGKTGKLLEFKKSWCRVSINDKVINHRKKYLQIHPDSKISKIALKKMFLQQNQEREALRKALEANISCSVSAPETATSASADGSKSTPSLPIDITPVQDSITRAWENIQHNFSSTCLVPMICSPLLTV